MGFWEWLFGRQETRRQAPVPYLLTQVFHFLIYNDDEEIADNVWYQRARWTNKLFVNYRSTWDADWRSGPEEDMPVAGISFGTRSDDFVWLAQLPDFAMHLEAEPTNPHDPYARKVMISATMQGQRVVRHIGYLPREIAAKYASVELAIVPSSAFLPPPGSGRNVGVKVSLLVRSARYKKQHNLP